MVVIGAKGFAKELLEDLVSSKYKYNETNLFFFDNVSDDIDSLLFNQFRVLKSFEDVKKVFEAVSPEFCLGIGTPIHRKQLSEKFTSLGGRLTSLISEDSKVGSFGNNMGYGLTIMSGARITNGVNIGNGTLINLNCTIGHDTTIGEFVELTPGVHISGHVKIGDLTSVGTGAVVIPKITIGKNCIIGAGSVVTKDVPDNSLVVGVPGKIIKTLD